MYPAEFRGVETLVLRRVEPVVASTGFSLTESGYNVVLRKPIPAQIRQSIPLISHHEEKDDDFVRQWTFSNRLEKHFWRDKVVRRFLSCHGGVWCNSVEVGAETRPGPANW